MFQPSQRYDEHPNSLLDRVILSCILFFRPYFVVGLFCLRVGTNSVTNGCSSRTMCPQRWKMEGLE